MLYDIFRDDIARAVNDISILTTQNLNLSNDWFRYRVAVRGRLTERELELRRAQTINKVNFEIQVMEDRVVDRREKLAAVDLRIEVCSFCDNRLFRMFKTMNQILHI